MSDDCLVGLKRGGARAVGASGTSGTSGAMGEGGGGGAGHLGTVEREQIHHTLDAEVDEDDARLHAYVSK